jgi:hypothetical protein
VLRLATSGLPALGVLLLQLLTEQAAPEAAVGVARRAVVALQEVRERMGAPLPTVGPCVCVGVCACVCACVCVCVGVLLQRMCIRTQHLRCGTCVCVFVCVCVCKHTLGRLCACV